MARGLRFESHDSILERRKRVEEILGEMQGKLEEISLLKKDFGSGPAGRVTPQQSIQLLEEIKVPHLESIREGRKKRPNAEK